MVWQYRTFGIKEKDQVAVPSADCIRTLALAVRLAWDLTQSLKVRWPAHMHGTVTNSEDKGRVASKPPGKAYNLRIVHIGA